MLAYQGAAGETRVVEAVLGPIRQPLTGRRSNGGHMRAKSFELAHSWLPMRLQPCPSETNLSTQPVSRADVDCHKLPLMNDKVWGTTTACQPRGPDGAKISLSRQILERDAPNVVLVRVTFELLPTSPAVRFL